MNNVTYGIIEEIYVFEGYSRISYGIAAYAPSNADFDTDITASILTSVRDISSDRKTVENLVRLYNHMSLSPSHLADVAEDFLAL